MLEKVRKILENSSKKLRRIIKNMVMTPNYILLFSTKSTLFAVKEDLSIVEQVSMIL